MISDTLFTLVQIAISPHPHQAGLSCIIVYIK